MSGEAAVFAPETPAAHLSWTQLPSSGRSAQLQRGRWAGSAQVTTMTTGVIQIRSTLLERGLGLRHLLYFSAYCRITFYYFIQHCNTVFECEFPGFIYEKIPSCWRKILFGLTLIVSLYLYSFLLDFSLVNPRVVSPFLLPPPTAMAAAWSLFCFVDVHLLLD